MRITIEYTVYEKKKKVTTEEDSDDQSTFEICQMVAEALIALGHHEDNVYDVIRVREDEE